MRKNLNSKEKTKEIEGNSRNKNTKKKDKGITLVLLVVTIIVMLILATIGIKTVKDGGIVNNSKEATQGYSELKENEQNSISDFIKGIKSNKEEGQLVLFENNQNNWSNEKSDIVAKPTIQLDGYEMYMKIDGGSNTWIKTDKLTITRENYTGDNMTVSAGFAKPGENINPRDIVTIPVGTLDFDNPTNTRPTATATTRKVTVECTQTDEKSGIDKTKTEYAIRKVGETEWSPWQKSNEFDNLDHNTRYEVKVKAVDKAGNNQESETTEVKTAEIIAGTLTLKINDRNGATYEENTVVDDRVWVKLNEGTNGTSTYESREGSAQEVEETTGETIITEGGTTTLVVKTTDGYNTVTREYVVKIRLIVPEVELREDGPAGSTYTNGRWTNQDIYHRITIDTEKQVEKYQITDNNGATWNDISNEEVQTGIDYESTFPLSSSEKPEQLGELVNNGTYYFDIEGTTLTSGGTHGNKDMHGTTADTYMPLDLSSIDEEKQIKLTVNYTISSESSYDYGYVSVTESTSTPDYNSTTGQFIKVSGSTTTSEKNTMINGGKQYYIHFCYRKDGSVSNNNDCFNINSIKLEADELGGYNFVDYSKSGNIVTYKITNEIEKTFKIKAVYTDTTESKTSEEFSIKIDKKKPTITGTSTLTSQTKANIQIQMSDSKSGVKGYYISQSSTTPTNGSNWTETNQNNATINNLNTSTKYYLWSIDNAGNISDALEITTSKPNYLIDNTIYTDTLASANALASDGSTIRLLNDYTDESAVSISQNITLDIGSYILTRTSQISINSSKTVTITGNINSKITTETANVNTIYNNGTLIVSGNATIENKSTNSNYGAIYNYGTVNINSGIINAYTKAIYNNGTVTMNGGTIIAEGGSSTYGIYNYSSTYSVTNIESGNIRATGTSSAYGICNYYSKETNINGGKIETSITSTSTYTYSYGVYAYYGGVTINGGEISGTTANSNAYSYGIYIYNPSTPIVIGNIERELNTETPKIYGKYRGVYSSDSSYNGFNFNNGVIQSDNEQTYYSKIIPREGYMPYTYNDETLGRYCTILVQAVNQITMTHTPTEWTNTDVKLTIKYPVRENVENQYSLDNTNWTDVSQNMELVNIEENRTIYARTLNSSGIVEEEAQHTISNIDKIVPEVSITPSKTKYEVDNEGDKANITYAITATDQGGSGLQESKYGWSTSDTQEPTTWSNIQNGVQQTKNNNPIGEYYLWLNVTDKAGNRSQEQVIRYTVTKKEPVAKIGSTQYVTIQKAIDAARVLNQGGQENVLIEIIKDTDEESEVYEDANVTIDLQGHKVGSSSRDTATITNNGTLVLKDSNTAHPGQIENLVGTAIKNNETFTMGEDDESISTQIPKVYGRKIGIDTIEGRFNFYDGTIIGETPIYKKISKTPEAYGPIAVDSGTLTRVYLGIASNYVARIDYVYYTTLQSAIDACPKKANNTKQTEITILKNIVLSETANVYEKQNVIIDLNNHNIETNTISTIINNKGDLCVTDVSVEQTGKISNTRTYNSGTNCIYNDGNGNFELAGGTITMINASTRYVENKMIYNNSLGTVKVTGGKIVVDDKDNRETKYYGVYNSKSGKVEFLGGEINLKTISGYNTFALYNSANGEIEVKGGNLFTDNVVIQNNADGKVTISGGMINHNNLNRTTIVNSANGEIDIIDGIISTESANYLIYNESGNINIRGGTIQGIGSYAGVMNKNGNIIMTGGIIDNHPYWTQTPSSMYNTWDNYNLTPTSGIGNRGTGTVKFLGGIIRCTSSSSDGLTYGIYNKDENGVIEIEKGLIESRDYAIGGIGIINIGKKGDGLVTKENPELVLRGTSKMGTGVNGSNPGAQFNFYDGIIQGEVTAIYGGLNEIEEGYKIKEETIDGYNSIYLEKIENNPEYVIQNQSNGIKYVSLSEAINSVQDNEDTELKVLKSFTISTPNNIISESKKITLDLCDNTINNKYFEIINYGELKIKDSRTSGTINNIDERISNYGLLEIQSGSIEAESTYISDRLSKTQLKTYNLYNSENGSIRINGGLIHSSVEGYCSEAYGIYNKGRLEVAAGTIESVVGNEAIRIYNLYSYGIYNTGNAKITGGNIKAINNLIYGNSGSSSDSFSLYNTSNGELEIDGGYIEAQSVGDHEFAVVNSSSKPALITGGIIRSDYTGISNGGELLITGGDIYGEIFGITNDSGKTVTIGTKGDGIVSSESPIISSSTTGLTGGNSNYIGIKNQSGILNFYDGIIKGGSLAVNGILTDWETEAELSGSVSEAKELYHIAEVRSAAIIEATNTEYNTLQEAINSCSTNAGNTQTTIKMLRSINLPNNSPITVSQGQNIKIDMQGYSIESGNETNTIINNGKLSIAGSGGNNGKINGLSDNIILNNQGATLNINSINIRSQSSGTETQYKMVINNCGNIDILNSNISKGGAYCYLVYNNMNGTAKITNTNITTSEGYGITYGIYNNGTGTVEIINGAIRCEYNNFYSYQSRNIGIINTNSGTIKIDGTTINTINSYSCCIENESNGTIIVESGELSANNVAINNKSTGIVIVGKNTEDNINTENPTIYSSIKSESYDDGVGIMNPNGTLKFYGGTIEGVVAAVSGNITEIKDNTELNIISESKIQLKQSESKPISLNGTRYNTLNEAINQCQNNTQSTVKLERDTAQFNANIIQNKNIIIDLNGHKLDIYQSINNASGTLKIIDSSGNNTGVITSTVGTAIASNGNTEFASGKITGNAYGISGTATITGGEISDNTYGAYGTITTTGGTIKDNTYGIYSTTGTSNIGSVTLNNNMYGVYSYGGTTQIQGTTFTNNENGIGISGGTVNIPTGTISGTVNGITGTGGNINLGTQGGTVTRTAPVVVGEEYGLKNNGSVVEFYDGTIKGKTGSIQGIISIKESGYTTYESLQDEYYSTYLIPAGTVTTVATIEGIEYTGLQTAINACMAGEETTIVLVNGTVPESTVQIPAGKKIILDIHGCAIRTETLGTLIQNSGELTIIDTSEGNTGNITNELGTAIENSGTLTIGEDDGTISTSKPRISGHSYGVANTGTLRFYDGIIQGETLAVNGMVNIRPSGTVIRQSESNGFKIYTLE